MVAGERRERERKRRQPFFPMEHGHAIIPSPFLSSIMILGMHAYTYLHVFHVWHLDHVFGHMGSSHFNHCVMTWPIVFLCCSVLSYIEVICRIFLVVIHWHSIAQLLPNYFAPILFKKN